MQQEWVPPHEKVSREKGPHKKEPEEEQQEEQHETPDGMEQVEAVAIVVEKEAVKAVHNAARSGARLEVPQERGDTVGPEETGG